MNDPRRLPAAATTCRRGPARRAGPTGSCPFLQWAERKGYGIDVCTNADLEDHPDCSTADQAAAVGRPRRVLVGPDARHGRGVHRPRRQRRVLLGQHLVLAGAAGGPTPRARPRRWSATRASFKHDPVFDTDRQSRADDHLVRPPHRSTREPHDRASASPAAATTASASGSPTAPAATRCTAPITGSSTAPASATATCSVPGHHRRLRVRRLRLHHPRRPAVPDRRRRHARRSFEILGTAPAAHFTRTTAARPPAPNEPSEVEFIAAPPVRHTRCRGGGAHRPRPCRARHLHLARRRHGRHLRLHRLGPRPRRPRRHRSSGSPRNVLDRLG